jgi:hypothetical protein
LLKAGIPVAAGIFAGALLLLAFLLLLGCHKLVFDGHATFTATNIPQTSNF